MLLSNEEIRSAQGIPTKGFLLMQSIAHSFVLRQDGFELSACYCAAKVIKSQIIFRPIQNKTIMENINHIAVVPNNRLRHRKKEGELLGQTSNKKPVRMQGMEITSKPLALNAASMLKLSRLCMARCEPQPGQSNPVKYLKGHFGKQSVLAGSKSW